METYESMEKLGMAIDTIENLLGALTLALPAQMHVDQLKRALPSVIADLRDVYVRETGDNPWDMGP